MRIVVDVLGGDNGYQIAKEAICDFIKQNPEIEMTIFGPKSKFCDLEDKCEIIDYDVPLKSDDILAVYHQKDSSLYQALNYIKDKEDIAFVSASPTGLIIGLSTLILKTLPDIKRAALVTLLPTKVINKQVVTLDVGGSSDNSPLDLEGFALLGKKYAQAILRIDDPRIYLLNNGKEENKGTATLKEAYKLLKTQKRCRFCGNIEARDALNGDADVIVTDGFTGNIFLKTIEGTALIYQELLNPYFKEMKGDSLLHEINHLFDYKNTGGALLLGVNGIVVKAHGNADKRIFLSSLELAKTALKQNLLKKMKEEKHG